MPPIPSRHRAYLNSYFPTFAASYESRPLSNVWANFFFILCGKRERQPWSVSSKICFESVHLVFMNLPQLKPWAQGWKATWYPAAVLFSSWWYFFVSIPWRYLFLCLSNPILSFLFSLFISYLILLCVCNGCGEFRWEGTFYQSVRLLYHWTGRGFLLHL